MSRRDCDEVNRTKNERKKLDLMIHESLREHKLQWLMQLKLERTIKHSPHTKNKLDTATTEGPRGGGVIVHKAVDSEADERIGC